MQGRWAFSCREEASAHNNKEQRRSKEQRWAQQRAPSQPKAMRSSGPRLRHHMLPQGQSRAPQERAAPAGAPCSHRPPPSAAHGALRRAGAAGRARAPSEQALGLFRVDALPRGHGLELVLVHSKDLCKLLVRQVLLLQAGAQEEGEAQRQPVRRHAPMGAVVGRCSGGRPATRASAAKPLNAHPPPLWPPTLRDTSRPSSSRSSLSSSYGTVSTPGLSLNSPAWSTCRKRRGLWERAGGGRGARQ